MTTMATANAFDLQQQANYTTIITGATCDPSYTGEFKRYVTWVKSQPHLATQVAPFLSRRNIDHYFTHVVASRLGNKGGMRRIVNALNFYAHNAEHVGADPEFNCASSVVETALKAQKIFNAASGGTANRGRDPHAGLKDILPESDRVRMMTHIFRARRDWGPASVNFTLGMNGAIRSASNRNFVWPDLRISHGFGAEKEGRLARAMMVVVRRGRLHKDRKETDEQVCMWRHKHYLLCSVFSSAAHVLFDLSNSPDIDFYHEEKNERADWWDTPLIEWDNYAGK
jgi:hypothetical protein